MLRRRFDFSELTVYDVTDAYLPEDVEPGYDQRAPALPIRYEVAPNAPRVRASDIGWTGSVKKAEALAHERKRSIITKASKLVPDPVLPDPLCDEASVKRIKALGQAQGFTEEQMLNVLKKRFYHRDWSKLVPFNLKILKIVFERGPAGW